MRIVDTGLMSAHARSAEKSESAVQVAPYDHGISKATGLATGTQSLRECSNSLQVRNNWYTANNQSDATEH